MRTYGQFCPIALGAEVFAERWTPLILRELFAGSDRFNDIQRGLPGIPRATLSQRLKHLERMGVIRRGDSRLDAGRYVLTDSGQALALIAVELGHWAKCWGYAAVDERNLDPDFLMWDIHRSVETARLPEGRTVVRFDLTGSASRSYWLLLEHSESSLCLTDPGFEIDLTVVADTLALHRVWMGELEWASALRTGLVTIEGTAVLRSSLPSWFRLGYFAR